MNQKELDVVIDAQFAACRELLTSKGADYSENDDRISNFKVNAARYGLSPIKVWAIYFGKHINAIESFVKKGSLSSEPIEGRIDDAINYLILLRALLAEAKGVGHADIRGI